MIMRCYKFILLMGLSLAVILLCACDKARTENEEIDMARSAYSAGHFTEAERLYEKYLQLKPEGEDRWEAWNRLLDVALSVRGDYEKAAGLLDAMVLEYGDVPGRAASLMTKLADVFEQMRDWDKAIDSWQKCLNLPDLPEDKIPYIHWKLSKIYQNQRDYDLAQDALKTCIGESRENESKAMCLYELAQTLGYQNNWPEARKNLSAILELKGVGEERVALATFMLADIYEQEGNFKEAIQLIQSIRDTYPNPKVIETRLRHLENAK